MKTIATDQSQEAEEPIGRVHSLESMGTTDGPGIRLIVFLQGCLFRCLYCHNRDTWDLHEGSETSIEEILQKLRRYQPFFASSGGGLTVSGGEPLLQLPFVTALFKAAKAEGFHTCLDTNGYIKHCDEKLDALLEVTDLVLLDLKQIDDVRHKTLAGVSNQRTLNLANYLSEKQQPMWIRHVLVPGYTDDEESVQQLGEFVQKLQSVERLEVLPFHRLGSYKWEALGEEDPLEGVQPPDKASVRVIQEKLERFGINVIV